MFNKNLILSLVIVSVFLIGCTKSVTPSKTTVDQNTNQTATGTVEPPPTQVAVIETNSEDIADDITKGEWVKAETRVKDIKSNMDELKPVLEKISFSTSTINSINTAISGLETAVTKKDAVQAKVQANAITKYIPDIMDKYKTDVPTDVGRLDFFGREIELNITAADWTAAEGNLTKTTQLWGILKPNVSTTYKSDIEKFQTTLDSLKSAISKKDTKVAKTEVSNLLENVDTLENNFKTALKAQ